MKRSVFLFLLMLCGSLSQAQIPEFSMWVKFFINDNPGENKQAFFGYDANASDSLEGKNAYTELMPGGEQMYPPPFQYNDVRFTGFTINRGYLGDGCPIDIRKKTDSVAFILNYEISITTLPEATSGSIIWDKNLIPSAVNHIYLEPATIGPGPWRKRTDMKTESRLDMPNRDSLSKYSKMLVSIYYNCEPVNSVAADEKLDRSLSLSSNPMTGESTMLSLSLEKPANVYLVISDMNGKELRQIEAGYVSGKQDIPLLRTLFAATGTYMLQVRATNSDGTSTAARILQVLK
jgi:hypothetical protein